MWRHCNALPIYQFAASQKSNDPLLGKKDWARRDSEEEPCAKTFFLIFLVCLLHVHFFFNVTFHDATINTIFGRKIASFAFCFKKRFLRQKIGNYVVVFLKECLLWKFYVLNVATNMVETKIKDKIRYDKNVEKDSSWKRSFLLLCLC